MISVETSLGPAGLDLDMVDGDKLLILGHGAGGGVDAPDLLAVHQACLSAGISVARFTQPYRVAGRKAPPAAAALDLAWREMVATIGLQTDRAVLFGGRSSGARVACRCAADPAGMPRPIAVVALAFPVHPPGKPDQTRLPEIDAVPVPVLVVQGTSDPFGQLAGRRKSKIRPGRKVVAVEGDHSLRKSAAVLGPIVAHWISALS